jgi:uridylate kinase
MKRVLLKISGEAIGGDSGSGYDTAVIDSLSAQLAEVIGDGAQIGLVVGGGNIFRGVKGVESQGFSRVSADFMGMLATIMNAVALREFFVQRGLTTTVMTPLALDEYVLRFNAFDAIRRLECGELLIFAGGTGHPFFTTDSAAALKACEIQADLLIKATKVDGVYDKDPVKNPDARRFTRLDYTEVMSRSLQVMDLSAVSLCSGNNIPIRVLNIFEKGAVAAVFAGAEVGTLIS